ncbi:hypothetical protein D4764_01G0000520 [Takifugu flavidus]|uniref:Uncharacterized protein n=1 Tax=Takifugu flavidus TaxID=433684 RepID=A0A5C6PPC8_9TELE|nr:hypothetical protein D4764_01G0000520 [Takifugu flavidus]
MSAPRGGRQQKLAHTVLGVRGELLLSQVQDVVGLSWLTRLYNIAWTSGAVLLDWQTGVVVPIFNSGDQRVCSNPSEITLLSFPWKFYARVLEKRIRLRVEPLIEEEQCRSILWGCIREYGVDGPLIRAAQVPVPKEQELGSGYQVVSRTHFQ